MDLNIYNEELTLIGVVDVIKSLIWNRKYFQSGVFELTAPATDNNLYCLREHYLIEKENSDEIGYINTLVVEEPENDVPVIRVTGQFLSGIFTSRVILKNNWKVSGLIDLNCIHPEEDNRTIQKLILGNFDDISFSNNPIGKQLSDQLEAIGRYEGFGYRVKLNAKDKQLIFEIVRGLDRSINQTVNPQVIFSQEYDNLRSTTYTHSDVGAINSVYGACKLPAGIEPCIPPTYKIDNGTGLNRFETYVITEAVTYDVTKWETVGTGQIEITRTYLDGTATLWNMMADCQKALVPITENFEGTVNNFTSGYKTLYNLGDIVTIFDEKLGRSINQRIYEVLETYDNENNAITPTFGSPARTIMDILKG